MAERTKTDDYQDVIKPRKYIIAHDSKANFMWNILIILSAIYLSILLPMKIAWTVIDEFVSQRMYLVVIENVIDLLFLIDILQSFFVSYVDTFSGDVITQPKLIAKRYMKGQFTIDMVSTMPF